MARADLYVVFDHVQFKKRYFENRNQIVSPRGEIFFVGVPVVTKGRYTQSIRDVEIDGTQRWQDKLLKSVEHNYKKAPYFGEYYDGVKEVINRSSEYRYLIELNLDLIAFFRAALGIVTPMLFSSEMEVVDYRASELILTICLHNHANTYLCGNSGRDYLDVEEFAKNNVHIEWLDYSMPEYRQLCREFVPNMSTLDMLFNHGERSLEILMGTGRR